MNISAWKKLGLKKLVPKSQTNSLVLSNRKPNTAERLPISIFLSLAGLHLDASFILVEET